MATRLFIALTASLLTVSGAAAAQKPASPVVPKPAVGDIAPDFAIAGATRYGLLRNPLRLSDFRGTTVVLAFFYQARTKG